MQREKIFLLLSIIVFFTIFGYFVLAWTEPISSPPNDNVDTPINVSSIPQTKEGDLTVNTQIEAPKYCIEDDCITSWPTGGSTGGCSNVFNSVQTNSGQIAYAGGCSDRLSILGTHNIKTTASGDNIYIQFSAPSSGCYYTSWSAKDGWSFCSYGYYTRGTRVYDQVGGVFTASYCCPF